MPANINKLKFISLKIFQARFYLDDMHDFVIEMAPIKCARIKVEYLHLSFKI